MVPLMAPLPGDYFLLLRVSNMQDTRCAVIKLIAFFRLALNGLDRLSSRWGGVTLLQIPMGVLIDVTLSRITADHLPEPLDCHLQGEIFFSFGVL